MLDRRRLTEKMQKLDVKDQRQLKLLNQIQAKFKAMGIITEDKHVKVILVTGDYDGQLTQEERFSVYKCSPTRKNKDEEIMCRMNRVHTDEPAMSVVFHGDNKIALIHCQNILSYNTCVQREEAFLSL